MLDVFLRRHRDTEAAKTVFSRLVGEHGVPLTVHTDTLWRVLSA
ncbi:hypothetical protein [Deinococcus sp. KSM4-11]